MGFWCPRLGSSFPTGPLGPTIVPHGTAELQGQPPEPSAGLHSDLVAPMDTVWS